MIYFMREPNGTKLAITKPVMPACPDQKTQRILLAATTVFLAHGFSASTTDMIQREAGVSKSTVYACYPNKEALFIAVIQAECDAFAQTLQRIRFAAGDLRKTLTVLGRAYLEILLSPNGLALYRVVISEAPRFPQLGHIFYLAGPRVIATMLTEQLAHAVQAGEIAVPLVGLDAAASLYSSLMRGDAQIQCLTHPDATPSAAQVDQWVELAVVTFLCAFGRSRPPPSDVEAGSS